MYWEEKLNRIKQQFSKSQFRDPFSDWSSILKKIEQQFIRRNEGGSEFCNWSLHIKNAQLIKSIPATQLLQELKRLKHEGNFWLVMIYGKSPSAKHLVYDCSLEPLEILIPYLFDFFIVDKKYRWLSFFSRFETANEVMIYRSGHKLTPFDDSKHD